jgi:hypothetical protein
MKTKRLWFGLGIAGLAVLAGGCAQRRVVYVPVYSAPAPAVVVPANPPSPTPAAPQPAVTVVAPMAPPSAPAEVVTATPGPTYYWVPGYWGWTGNAWVWVSGRWVVRPAGTTVWVGGYWARHGRGYVWVSGHWR